MDEYLSKSKTSGDIYRLLYYGESSSRQDISQTLGISLPTTTRCLNSLCSAGLVQSAGESQSTGGRKATIYEYVPQARYAAGIDITRNHLSIVLVDLGLNILDARRLRIPFEANEQYFSTLTREYEDMIARNLPDRSCLLGTGISVPVLLGDDHKTINYAVNSIFHKLKLNEKKKTFHSLRHTFISNSANNGTSIHVLQKLVGHSSVRMTMDYYQTNREVIDNTISALPDYSQSQEEFEIVRLPKEVVALIRAKSNEGETIADTLKRLFSQDTTPMGTEVENQIAKVNELIEGMVVERLASA